MDLSLEDVKLYREIHGYIERNLDRHPTFNQMDNLNAVQFIFKTGYFSNHNFTNMCKYLKIDLSRIIEWQIQPKSNRSIEIIFFVSRSDLPPKNFD